MKLTVKTRQANVCDTFPIRKHLN